MRVRFSSPPGEMSTTRLPSDPAALRRIVDVAVAVARIDDRLHRETAARIRALIAKRSSRRVQDTKVAAIVAADADLRTLIAQRTTADAVGAEAWAWLTASDPEVPGRDPRVEAAGRARQRAETERDDLAGRLAGAQAELASQGEEIDALRQRIDDLTGDLEDRFQVLETARAERDGVKAELTRQQLAWETQRAELRQQVSDRDALVEELLVQRDRLDRELGRWRSTSAPTGHGSEPTRTRPRPAATTRRPLGIPGGELADSPKATRHLLARSDVVMIVDGCNVALGREASGALADRREDLLNALDAHRSRYGTRVVVIFDGDAYAAGGGRNTRIRIVFTDADVIADDLIVKEVLELPDDQAVVVVTDDQGLRSRLRPLGADVVGVGAMWSLLRS